MIRVSNSYGFSYWHKFAVIFYSTVQPLEHTQIQNFTILVDDQARHSLKLRIGDEWTIIFRINMDVYSLVMSIFLCAEYIDDIRRYFMQSDFVEHIAYVMIGSRLCLLFIS